VFDLFLFREEGETTLIPNAIKTSPAIVYPNNKNSGK
jgi:hypothetical protein